MAVLLGEDRREKIDEALAILGAELPPDANLAAVAIVMLELRRPGIHRDPERNSPLLEKIRGVAHVLQGSSNDPFDPQRGAGCADTLSRQSPARYLRPAGL